uniref:IS3 family transposase n=1 Tax=Escherichia coli TaxID=562 RepID=UPI0022E59687
KTKRCLIANFATVPFEDLNLFNQRMAEYLVLYNSKRPHKSLELMTPVDYILRESKNCNMWWTHTSS